MRIYFSVSAARALGHALRTLPIAEELANRGHDILYGSSTNIEDLVTERGIPFVSTEQEHPRSISTLNSQTAEKIEESIATEKTIVKEFQPSIVISDPGLFTRIIAPDATIVRITQGTYLHVESPDTSMSAREKERIRSVYRGVTKQLGSEMEFATFFADTLFVPGIREFETAYPSKALFFGPITQLRTPSKGLADIAYVTLGTGNQSGKLLEEVTESLGHFSTVHVATGHASIHKKGNVSVKKFYDGIPEDAGIVVCHGGHGTIYQTLHSGKQLVVIPTNLDQVGQAYNVARLRLGTVVPYRVRGTSVTPDISSLGQILAKTKEHTYLPILPANQISLFADHIGRLR